MALKGELTVVTGGMTNYRPLTHSTANIASVSLLSLIHLYIRVVHMAQNILVASGQHCTDGGERYAVLALPSSWRAVRAAARALLASACPALVRAQAASMAATTPLRRRCSSSVKLPFSSASSVFTRGERLAAARKA